MNHCSTIHSVKYSRANFLMDGLLEVLVVDDGPDLAVVVGGPERGGHISAGLAGINPGK